MSTPTPTAVPLLQGRYRIEDRLGASRLAVVYRAQDERLGRKVLVHLLRRELAGQDALRERFIQEARHNAGRSHRSLLDIYDTGELAGRPFMVTEYVAGRSLRDLGALSLEDALLYFRQVVGAVAACQAAGVPHPPISSANILVVGEGHVELLESWLVAPDQVLRDLACYRPPERSAGVQLTPAGVVYSLGLLLIELLAGRRPIDGDDARAVAQAHLTASIPTVAQLQPRIYAPALERLVRQMVERDPQRRIPSAAALASALDVFQQAISGETQKLRLPEAPSIRERVRSETSRLMRAPVVRPRPQRAPDPGQDLPPQSVAPPGTRAVAGLVVAGILFLAVVCGAYTLGSMAVEQLADVRLPRLELPLPNLGFELPEWLTGVVEGQGEVLQVTIVGEGLNLRDAPGLETQVMALLPNGTQVRRLEGPQVVDGVAWLKVRVRIEGREVEGWVSANYVRPI